MNNNNNYNNNNHHHHNPEAGIAQNMNMNMGGGGDIDLMVPYDFNDVPDQGFELIPSGVKAKLNIELIKPDPGMSANSFLHKSKESNLHYLRLKFIIVSNPSKGRVFTQNFMYGIPGVPRTELSNQLSEGTVKAVNIALSNLKAMVQSARGIDPKDKQANCAIRSFQELHHIQIAASIKIAKNKDPAYSDSNEIAYVIRTNNEDYGPIMRGTTITPESNGDPSYPQQTSSYSQPSPSAPPDNGEYNNGAPPAWVGAGAGGGSKYT